MRTLYHHIGRNKSRYRGGASHCRRWCFALIFQQLFPFLRRQQTHLRLRTHSVIRSLLHYLYIYVCIHTTTVCVIYAQCQCHTLQHALVLRTYPEWMSHRLDHGFKRTSVAHLVAIEVHRARCTLDHDTAIVKRRTQQIQYQVVLAHVIVH